MIRTGCFAQISGSSPVIQCDTSSVNTTGNASSKLCTQNQKVCNSSSSVCTCSSVNLTNIVYYNEANVSQIVLSSFKSSVSSIPNRVNNCSLDSYIFRIPPQSLKRDGSTISSGVFISLTGNDLVINSDYNPETCTVFVSTPLFHMSYPFTRVYTINNNIAYSTNLIEVQIICSGIISLSASFVNEPPDTCIAISGQDFRCMSVTLKAFTIIGIIIACILFLVVLIKLYLTILHHHLLNCCVSDNSEVEMQPVERSRSRSPIPRHFKFTIALLMFCCVAQACDQSIVLSSNTVQCIGTSSVASCNIATQSLFTFPGQSSSVCLYFVDPVSHFVVLNLNFTLVSVSQVFSLNQDYFTYFTNAALAATKTCSVTGLYGCNSGFCNSMPALSSWFSHQACIPTCGCAACGCFSCDSACTYVTWQRVLYSQRSRALSPVFGSKYITVRIDNSTGPSRFISFTNSAPFFSQDSFSTSISSTFSPNSGLLNLKIAELDYNTVPGQTFTGFGYKIIPSQLFSPRSYPQPGSYGDIQCVDSQCTSGVETQYMPDFYAGSSSIQFYNFPSSVSLLSPNFPDITPSTNVLGYNLVFNTTHMVASPVQPDSVTMSVSLFGDYRVQVHIDQICPKIETIEVLGCYLCETGYMLKVTARSTLQPGMATIESPSGLSPSVLSLTQQNSVFYLTSYSFNKEVSDVLTLKGTYCSDSLSYYGVLLDPPILNSTVDYVKGAIQSAQPNSFENWWNSLTGTATAVKAIFIVGCAFVAMIVVVIIVSLFFKIALPMINGYRAL